MRKLLRETRTIEVKDNVFVDSCGVVFTIYARDNAVCYRLFTIARDFRFPPISPKDVIRSSHHRDTAEIGGVHRTAVDPLVPVIIRDRVQSSD